MKTNLSSSHKIYFPFPPTQIDWVYSGPQGITGVAAKAKIEESFARGVQITKDEYKVLLQKEETSWAQYQASVLEKLQERYEAWLNEFIALLPDYLTTIVEHLLPKAEIKLETMEELVSLLLKEGNEKQQKITVFLSEKDAKWLKALNEKFNAEYPLLNFETDSSLVSGDCRLKTTWGEIDGRLKTRLEELKIFFQH